MKYEQRMNAGGMIKFDLSTIFINHYSFSASGFDMSDWNNPYNASPPSSRGGDDDASSVNHSRSVNTRISHADRYLFIAFFSGLDAVGWTTIFHNQEDPFLFNQLAQYLKRVTGRVLE